MGLSGIDKDADYSLRGSPERGRGDPRFFRAIAGRDLRVLLVHGYNVSERQCVAACRRFREELVAYSRVLEDRTFTCTWPGDIPIPVIGGAGYPLMIRHAKHAAGVLYNAICEWQGQPYGTSHLAIVAHSLGCRLVLETLRHMHVSGFPPNLERLTVILMAAAVPATHLEPGGDLDDVPRRAADGVRTEVFAYHSAADGVLTWLFRPGQFLGFDRFSEAVGLRGRPWGQWTGHAPMNGFGHGSYWASAEMALQVGRHLGLAASQAVAHPALAPRPPLPSRSVATRGALPFHRR